MEARREQDTGADSTLPMDPRQAIIQNLQLLKQIEEGLNLQIQILQAMPPYMASRRFAIGSIFAVIVLLPAIAFIVFFIRYASNSQRSTGDNDFAGLMSSLAALAAIGLLRSRVDFANSLNEMGWNKLPEINHHQYDGIVSRIQLDLIDQAVRFPIDSRPLTDQQIQIWQQAINDLGYDSPLDQMIIKLQRLMALAIQTKADINTTQLSCTFFPKTPAEKTDMIINLDSEKNTEKLDADTCSRANNM